MRLVRSCCENGATLEGCVRVAEYSEDSTKAMLSFIYPWFMAVGFVFASKCMQTKRENIISFGDNCFYCSIVRCHLLRFEIVSFSSPFDVVMMFRLGLFLFQSFSLFSSFCHRFDCDFVNHANDKIAFALRINDSVHFSTHWRRSFHGQVNEISFSFVFLSSSFALSFCISQNCVLFSLRKF